MRRPRHLRWRGRSVFCERVPPTVDKASISRCEVSHSVHAATETSVPSHDLCRSPYQGFSFQPSTKPTPRHQRAAFSGLWRAYCLAYSTTSSVGLPVVRSVLVVVPDVVVGRAEVGVVVSIGLGLQEEGLVDDEVVDVSVDCEAGEDVVSEVVGTAGAGGRRCGRRETCFGCGAIGPVLSTSRCSAGRCSTGRDRTRWSSHRDMVIVDVMIESVKHDQ